LEGVAFLHERKIMHRDLNPLNIMISGDNLIKIIDLGLAIRTTNEVVYPVCGTPGFMAPEVINYQKDVGYNEKADVFSIGLIIYKLYKRKLRIFSLTGDSLFQK
jgi:calcium/calmodulin-dependent protein kinase (CaM kinase) II/calcium-dependent protein kinase